MYEFEAELPTDAGLPTLQDMERWRAVLDGNVPGGSLQRLIGIREADGCLIGIFTGEG